MWLKMFSKICGQKGVENILKVEHKSKDVQEHFVYIITVDSRRKDESNRTLVDFFWSTGR
jgi:hypothetical protein